MINRSWLVASDIHGSADLWDSIYDEVERYKTITTVVLCGDLTNSGVNPSTLVDSSSEYVDFLLAQYNVKRLGELVPLYWIPGNHDHGIGASDFDFHNVHNIDNRTVKIDGLSVHGINQSPCFDLPWLAQEWRNMSDRPEVDAAAFGFEPVDIVVSHCPPLGILDRIGDASAGSPALRQYILDYKPKHIFCGHVHEHGGEVEHLGETNIANMATTFQVFDI